MNFNAKLTTALHLLQEARPAGVIEAALDEYLDRYNGHMGQAYAHIIGDLIRHYRPQIAQRLNDYNQVAGSRPELLSGDHAATISGLYQFINPARFVNLDQDDASELIMDGIDHIMQITADIQRAIHYMARPITPGTYVPPHDPAYTPPTDKIRRAAPALKRLVNILNELLEDLHIVYTYYHNVRF